MKRAYPLAEGYYWYRDQGEEWEVIYIDEDGAIERCGTDFSGLSAYENSAHHELIKGELGPRIEPPKEKKR